MFSFNNADAFYRYNLKVVYVYLMCAYNVEKNEGRITLRLQKLSASLVVFFFFFCLFSYIYKY